MAWTLYITRPAKKDLASLPQRDRAAMIEALDRLSDNPASADFLKLSGYSNRWRLRVGSWRAIVAMDNRSGSLRVLRILPRGRAYRD